MSPFVDPSVQATAYTAAACRAAETRRPRPRLHDPLAELFIPDGPAAAIAALAEAGREEVVGRTVLIDRMLAETLAQRPGATVVNLGAGYCTRPYRLDLAACREVIEADDPAVIAAKEEILASRRPACPVRRVGLDVRDGAAVAGLLARAVGDIVVITEGLLVYLTPPQVHALAARLADVPAIVRWLADVVSGASARQMQALASGAPGGLVLHGLDSLAPLEEPGWTVAAYRALPVSRPRREPVGPACSTVVDGVIALDRSAGPATA